jgi:hypothetical protein
MGIVLFIVQMGHFSRYLVTPEQAEKPWFKPFAAGMVRMERWTKLAVAYKMQKMLANALFCHSDANGGGGDGGATMVEQQTPQLYPTFQYDEHKNHHVALCMAAQVLDDLHGDDTESLFRFQEQANL